MPPPRRKRWCRLGEKPRRIRTSNRRGKANGKQGAGKGIAPRTGAFPHSNFGYIANYKITSKENVQIRTWHQLHNFLQKEVESLQGTDEINFFYSYLFENNLF